MGGNAANFGENLEHERTPAHNSFESAGVQQLPLQLQRAAPGLRVSQYPIDSRTKLCGVEGFCEIVARPLLNSFDRRVR
jgi:hypothetical protein